MSVCIHESLCGHCMKGNSPYLFCTTPCCHYVPYPYGNGLRIKLYYYVNGDKVTAYNFGDGTNVTDALHKAMDWCKENCEERGLMEYYYKGYRIRAEQF